MLLILGNCCFYLRTELYGAVLDKSVASVGKASRATGFQNATSSSRSFVLVLNWPINMAQIR